MIEQRAKYHPALPDIAVASILLLAAYLAYFFASRLLRQNMTLMVRQLAPGPQGPPIEGYCFASCTAWTAYENVQADIFDQLLAIVPEFGLCLFQQPADTEFSMKQAWSCRAPMPMPFAFYE